jgi:WD40 repeat protein/serine/threonine protein kinase
MAAVAAGRDLLFGLLALQTGLIRQEQLVAAFHAWTGDKSRPLADHLIALGHLNAAQRAAVEALAALHVDAHGGEPEKSLASIPAGRSTRERLAALGDPELNGTVAQLAPGSTEADADRTMTYSVGEATSDGQRYRVLRPHARGGLGAVFVALDSELHREVALKELRPERADDPDSRARFLLEAEITGRLEHPGVVPVYGLGCDAQGRPFYAMRLVKGESLKEAIERFHATEASGAGDPRRWNLALRQLLNRFVAVCNVVAFAHSRGVIHRDLKPANILLGPYGETLVVDWGLAKVVGRGETAAPTGAAEATLQPASGSGSSETLPGTALGTPAYMSPEQAEGRLEQVGPLSDLYSLGATLYCLLVGKPTIEESEIGSALRRAQRGEFPPPRAVNPRVPGALEAICLKAMVSRPEDRYASPRALAHDLEHWLADEPVAVYRDPLPTRLARWGRRHRPAAVGLGVLLVTAVAALAVSTVLIGFEQSRTREQFNRAEANLAVAKQQRERADDKAREANERAERLRREDYVNRVNIALREIQDDGNVALAERLLDGCPADLRGWEWDYVKRQAHLDIFTYRGHVRRLPVSTKRSAGWRPEGSAWFDDPSVRCVAISPDGTWAASGTGPPYNAARDYHRSEIRLWDIRTGGERRVLDGLVGAVQSVAISPDGKLLAAAGGYYIPAGGWLRLWDVTTGIQRPRPIRDVSGMAGMSVAFSPDGEWLAVGYGQYAGGGPGRLTLVNLHTDEQWLPERKADFGTASVAFCPDPSRPLLAASGEQGVELWDWKARTRAGRLPSDPQGISGPAGSAISVAFSRDGRRIALGVTDYTVRLWEPGTDKEPRVLYGHKALVQGVALSPDGTRNASVAEDRSVRLWDVATGRELATFYGHTGHVFAVAFHPDGRRILSGGIESVVKVWDVGLSRPIVTGGHSSWVTGVAFRRDGRAIATESDLWLLYLGQRRTIEKMRELRKQTVVEKKYWDLDTGKEIPSPGPPGAVPAFGPYSRWPGVKDDAFPAEIQATSPDGQRVAKVDRANAPYDVRVIDAATGRLEFTLVGHTHEVTCIAFSPKGRRIATTSFDRTVKLWDSETGLEVLTLRGHTAGVVCVAFSPDGHRLVSGDVDSTARVWDAKPLAAGGLSADTPVP